MRKMIRVLFVALLVIPTLTITQVKANGPVRPPEQPQSFNRSFNHSNESFLQRLFHELFGSRDHHSGGPVSSGSGTRAPLDGGLSILLAAGIGLGVKKAFKKKDHQEESKEENNELA